MPAWKRYLFTVILLSLVSAIKLLFYQEFARDTPLLFLGFVTLFCAWFFDLGPGAISAAGSIALSVYAMSNDRDERFTGKNFITLMAFSLELLGVLWLVWFVKREGTIRKRWSQAQKEVAEALENLHSCATGILDSGGNILGWNRGAYQMYGYANEEIEGYSWTCLFPPDDIKNKVPEKILKAVDKFGSWTGEIRRVRKNGTQFWGLMLVAWMRSGGYLVFVQDITNQKNLQERQEKWRLIFDQGAWAVSVCDNSNIITDVNASFAKMYGYEPEELVGKPMSVVYAPEYVGDSKQCVIEALHKGSNTCEGLHISKGGVRFPVRTHLTFYKDCNGKPLYYAAIHQNITQERQIQRDLRKLVEDREFQQKMKDAEAQRHQTEQDVFLATLAHELRNPLQPIATTLHMAKNKAMDVADLELVNRNFCQIQRLVDDIMDVSRLASGKIQLQMDHTDLREILSQTANQVYPLLKQRGQKFYNSLPTDSIYVNGDGARLSQIFTNLLNNASKYTDFGGTIWLTAERQGQYVEVKIRDNGIGIETKMLPRIFELFAQAEHAVQRAQGGLGLGLTLVKKLVELHGGTVVASSDGIGKGSCFTVRLPVSEATVPEAEPQPSKDFNSLSDRKVLVVDDNVDAAVSMQMMLAMDGCEVVIANDGVEALEAFDAFHPDLVLLDIGLPKLDGREVARRIRAKNKDVVLIAVSGYGTPGDIAASKEAGFDHHVVKPVEPNGFKRLISAALDKHGRGTSHVGIHN